MVRMGKKRKFEQRESFVVTFEGWQADDLHIEADRQRVPIGELIRSIVSGFLNREVVLPDDSAQFDYLDKYTPPD